MKRKKRKSFANVFWGKFFWITLVLAGLYMLGMCVFVTVSKENCWDAFCDAENNRRRNIREGAQAEDFVRKQQFHGAVMAERDQIVSVLYDANTKELIAGCEEQMVILRSKTEEAPSTMYCYPTADVPEWSAYRKEIEQFRKKSNLVSETVEMTYLYQKGDDVIPGPFTVSVSVVDLFEFEVATNGYEPENVFVRNFDMSSVIPEDYEQMEVGMDHFQLDPLLIGYSPTNPWMYNYGGIHWAYEFLQEEYGAVKQEGKEIEGFEYWSFFTLTMESCVEEELENGQTVALLSVARYDLWESYKSIFIIIAVALLVFGALLALVLAKITYAQLKAHYRMEDYRKNLMNTMAHDLKSPLMSISGYAENLANHMVPDKQEYYANAILENVQYMNGIVESVLTLSKTEQMKMVLSREELDMAELLKEVQKRYGFSLEEKGLQVQVTGQLTLKADRGLMLQALDNLLGNAVKYATRDSVIEVEFSDKYLQMQNACEEDLSDVADTLCEPFVVGSKSRTGKRGSGMGLAIVKNICELHRYRLQVVYEKGLFNVKIIFLKK